MASAAIELDSQVPILDEEFDVDSLLQGFPCDFADDLDLDLGLWSSNSSPDDSTPNSPKESVIPLASPLFAVEIEKFLMEDDEAQCQVEDDGKYVDEFLAGILVDESALGAGSNSERSEMASPESEGSADSEAAAPPAANEMRDRGERDDEDEQISKKRRRQMRNRESAMQSRERKKLYVKDLEIKSKYLEAECRRLDYALRCYMAENVALHQRLQKDGATAAKQESAVLFTESLLLGSLFWLVSTVFLFLVPSLQILNQRDASGLGRGPALEAVGSKTILTRRPQPDFGFDLLLMRRRCRGSRTRMKAVLFPLHGVSSVGVF